MELNQIIRQQMHFPPELAHWSLSVFISHSTCYLLRAYYVLLSIRPQQCAL